MNPLRPPSSSSRRQGRARQGCSRRRRCTVISLPWLLQHLHYLEVSGPALEGGKRGSRSRPQQSQDRHWEVFEPPVFLCAGQVPLRWAPVKGCTH